MQFNQAALVHASFLSHSIAFHCMKLSGLSYRWDMHHARTLRRCKNRHIHIRSSPVISPNSEDASNTDGLPKTKVAVPVDPSLARVRFTSGMDGSLTPLMNWMSAAMQTMSLKGCALLLGLRGAAIVINSHKGWACAFIDSSSFQKWYDYKPRKVTL